VREIQQHIGNPKDVEQNLSRMQDELWQTQNEPQNQRTISTDSTLVAQDFIVWCDDTLVFDLIDPSNAIGREYYIKNIGDGTVFVQYVNINDVTTQDITTKGGITVYPRDGSGWWLI